MCSKRLDLVFSFLDSPISLPDFVLTGNAVTKTVSTQLGHEKGAETEISDHAGL